MIFTDEHCRRQQIEAFLVGFHDLISPSLISVFTPAELELLVCGLPDVDVNDMKSNTDYHQYRYPNSKMCIEFRGGVYSRCCTYPCKTITRYWGRPTDDVIVWFWEALRSFTREERAQFLQFVTGTSKVPLEGFANLRGMRGVQKFSIHKVCPSCASKRTSPHQLMPRRCTARICSPLHIHVSTSLTFPNTPHTTNCETNYFLRFGKAFKALGSLNEQCKCTVYRLCSAAD
jgi:hypothetical protein